MPWPVRSCRTLSHYRRYEQSGYNPNIALAPKTKGSPIDKRSASPGLLAYVTTATFGEYLPLPLWGASFRGRAYNL